MHQDVKGYEITYIPPFGKGRLGGIFIMKNPFIKSPLSPLC
jgi:hypothetical protein